LAQQFLKKQKRTIVMRTSLSFLTIVEPLGTFAKGLSETSINELPLIVAENASLQAVDATSFKKFIIVIIIGVILIIC
jgi:hypothetical protein